MGRLGKIAWIEIFQGKERKSRQDGKLPARERSHDGILRLPPRHREVIAIALGFMRSNTWITVGSMFLGKLIRYILLLYVLESAWDAVAT